VGEQGVDLCKSRDRIFGIELGVVSSASTPDSISQLMITFRCGDRKAGGAPGLAAPQMKRARCRHTWQPAMMKRVLIHHARPLNRPVEQVELAGAPKSAAPTPVAWHEADDALSRLGTLQ
jgi:hypothetical protein